MIKLNRPLAFLDLETTGINRETDRIIEIAILKLHPNGTKEVKTRRINPCMPIPAEVTELTGITDDDVKDEPVFRQLANGLYDFIKDCDIAGFNSNAFDVPLLFNEFSRVGIYWDHSQFRMIDVGNIFKIQEPRTLTAAVKFYTGKEHEDAHGALADIEATLAVFEAQLERYDEVPTDIQELELFCNYGKKRLDLAGKFVMGDDDTILLNFGAHRGEPAEDNLDFIGWMMSKDFPADTLAICRTLLQEGELFDDDF